MTSKTTNRFSPEVRARAVGMGLSNNLCSPDKRRRRPLGGLAFLRRMECVEVVGGRLCLGGGRDDCALIGLQHLK